MVLCKSDTIKLVDTLSKIQKVLWRFMCLILCILALYLVKLMNVLYMEVKKK